MTHKERFFATLAYQPVDRPASWLVLPVDSAIPGLLQYFGAADMGELKRKIDDDVYPVEMPYHSPTSNAIYAAFDFSKESVGAGDERTLTAPGFFEEMTDPARVDEFDWPDPEQYIDPEECRRAVAQLPDDYAKVGIIWSAHFQDVCAAFGMETALVNMLVEPDIFRAVHDKITAFYLKANEIFFEATKGMLDAVLIGNDLGSQRGLMISRENVREFVIPDTVRLIRQAQQYGLKVIHHSCGSIFEIIPDLIEAGVDVVHPIQALAKNMEPWRLKEHFYGKVAFCGGVDAQDLLVRGTPDQIRAKVKELKGIFPTGLVISPSHEAILPDVRPENVAALFEAVHS